MTVIEFRPRANENYRKETPQQTQKPCYNTRQLECDCLEFKDYEILDEEETGLFSKIKKMFAKQAPTPKNTLTQKDAHYRAKSVMCDSIVTRNEVSAILEMMTCQNNERYLRQLHNSGIDVSFEELDINRTMMFEHDSQGNIKRKTTFFTRNLEVISIEEPTKKGRGVDKITFFNPLLFEVKKGMTSNNKMREFYSFEDNKPSIFKKDCTRVNHGLVGKEEYIF